MISQATASGGGDVPEAVIEALDAGTGLFPKEDSSAKLPRPCSATLPNTTLRGENSRKAWSSHGIKSAEVGLQTVMLPVTSY